MRAAVGFAFGLGCFVEGLQALDAGARLGLAPGGLASIALGTTFDARDLVAYAVGAALVAIVELKAKRMGPARTGAIAPR
jgi:hypothetical protein